MRARIKSPPQEMPITMLKGNCCSVGADDDADDHDDGYDENDRRQEDDVCINIIF